MDSNDIVKDRHALADTVGAFAEKHGVEEAGKLMSRFLLGIAHSQKADEINFRDDIGHVVIKPQNIPNSLKH